MDSVIAQAAAAGVTLSQQDLAQIQKALDDHQNQHNNKDVKDNNISDHVHHDDSSDEQQQDPGLYCSTIKRYVAEELKSAAHSFASTRMIPEIWRWAALCKLRHDIEKIFATEDVEQNNNTTSRRKLKKNVSNEYLLANCIPFAIQIEKEPTSSRVLKIVNVIPCAEFTTHAVVVADTEVKYIVTERIRKSAEDIIVVKSKKKTATTTAESSSTNGSQAPPNSASSSVIAVIPPSCISNQDDVRTVQNQNQNQTSSSSSALHPFDYSLEVTIIWRTMHFVRKDGVVKGSYEIQSTACRFFECRCPDTGNVFAWCGAKGVQSLLQKNHHSLLLLSSGKFHETWWRGYLECYTRPTIHFVFVWLLWQNNPDLRSYVEKRKNLSTTSSSSNSVNNNRKTRSSTAEEVAIQRRKKADREKREFEKAFSMTKKKKKTLPARRKRSSSSTSDDDSDGDDNGDDNNDDDQDQEQQIEVEDFLEDLKTKLHLTLFDHNPSFAIFGMGMNVITNYLSVLFPWADCHVAELEPSVFASNVLSEDFCEKACDLIESKKKDYYDNQEKSSSNCKPYDQEVPGKQHAHIGDVVQLLGVSTNNSKNEDASLLSSSSSNEKEKEKDEERSSDESSSPPIPEQGLSLIFLDCFDPVAVNMDHSLQVLGACHRRLRKGGVLITNTHMALTNQGTELRPFLEVFGGDEAVHVISIYGYQQALIVCQKAKNFGNKKNKPLVISPPPQNIREYRAACRVANACPVFVNVCGGVLQAIDKTAFFGSSTASTTMSTSFKEGDNFCRNNSSIDDSSTSSSTNQKTLAGGFIFRTDSLDDEDALFIEPVHQQHQRKSCNNKTRNKSSPAELIQQQLPSITEYPSLFCRAKHRIHESCECLACTSKWLDPSVIVESRRLTVKMENKQNKNKNENDDSENNKVEENDNDAALTAVPMTVSAGRWVTRCIDFKDPPKN